MADVKIELHEPPACGVGGHGPGCRPDTGHDEVCVLIEERGLCICVHWPQIEDYAVDLSRLECSVVDNRKQRA